MLTYFNIILYMLVIYISEEHELKCKTQYVSLSTCVNVIDHQLTKEEANVVMKDDSIGFEYPVGLSTNGKHWS